MIQLFRRSMYYYLTTTIITRGIPGEIVNLEDPIALQDAATRNYVDNQISFSIDNSEKEIMKTLADEIKKLVTKPELNQATENIANAINIPINTMTLNVNNLLSRVTQLE